MTGDRSGLNFGDRVLIFVVTFVSASTVMFAGAVARSFVERSLTPALANSGFSFASLLMSAALGLLPVTRSFDEAHPRYIRDRAGSAFAAMRRLVACISAR